MNNPKYDGVFYPVREVNDLKEIITSSAELFADKTAYLEKDKKAGKFMPVTYRQMKDDIDALGTGLIDMGLQGEKIAVIGETSVRWLLTYYTTVCGVGVIVPLDKNLPSDELKNLIRRSGAKALVFSQGSEKSIAGVYEEKYDVEHFICMKKAKDERALSMDDILERGRKLLGEGDRRYVDAEIDPDQMATLMFTSGTTGASKGVMLSHRNIASNVMNMSKLVNLDEGGIVLSILPCHHAYEMNCAIWTTMYQGRTLAICEGIRYIQKNMAEVGANYLVGVPLVFEKIYKGMWKQAAARGEAEKLRKAIDISRKMKLYNNRRLMKKLFKAIHHSFGCDMRLMVAGGAAIDPKVIEDFEAMGFPMIQGYGMSENAPIIAVNQDRYGKAASVGRPMPGTEVRIDNPDENGIGEVVTRGPSVMMGYYDNEEATAEVLKDGWLYTGDLGYLDDEGFLYLTGRKKTVIVTKGGKNIFPEELEAVIAENELIGEVLVHGVADEHIGNVIVTAEIFPNYDLLREQEGEMSGSEIYHFFRKYIEEVNKKWPPYKAIKRIHIRDKEFDKTTTGKIKRYGNQGDSSLGKEDIMAQSYQEIKAAERRRAEDFVRTYITESTDPYVRYKESRPITDVRDMFTSSVELYGDNVAFRQKFGKGQPYTEITYKRALADVNGLGTALINRGLKGKRISIIGETCYQWETTYLAVIGGVGLVVPLDKELGPKEIKGLVADSGVSAVVCGKKFVDTFKEIRDSGETNLEMVVSFDSDKHEGDVLSWKELIEEGKNQVALGDRQYLDAEVIADEMAVLLYTSGTTGLSKGVMLSNTNLAYNLMAAPTILKVNPWDIFFSVLPVHHTYECTCDFLMPLYKGASIAFCEGLRYITQNLEEVKPTMILGVPALIETLYKKIMKNVKKQGKDKTLARLLKANRKTKKLGLDISKPFTKQILDVFGGRMRVIISGGAAIDPEILQFFNDIGIIGVQGYGLTECSPMAALNPDVEKDMRNAAAGHLLPGMEVKIEDPDEDGVGEICFRGDNVMMGYYNNEAATNDVLRDGWFYSGDLGYVDEQNFVYITGRKKNVIITKNGKNVFPEEIEYYLSRIPYIAESMVWGDENDEGTNDTSIVATIVTDAEELEEALGAGYTDEQVKDLLWKEIDKVNEELPLFKRVKKINVRTEEFEKNTSKKIKRFVDSNKEEHK